MRSLHPLENRTDLVRLQEIHNAGTYNSSLETNALVPADPAECSSKYPLGNCVPYLGTQYLPRYVIYESVLHTVCLQTRLVMIKEQLVDFKNEARKIQHRGGTNKRK